MEFNFSLPRLGLLAGLLALFWLLGGFSPVAMSGDSFHDPRRVARAWRYCIMLYIAGAGCVSVVDHCAGNLDRTNLRAAWILLGCVLMAGSGLWLHILRGTVSNQF